MARSTVCCCTLSQGCCSTKVSPCAWRISATSTAGRLTTAAVYEEAATEGGPRASAPAIVPGGSGPPAGDGATGADRPSYARGPHGPRGAEWYADQLRLRASASRRCV